MGSGKDQSRFRSAEFVRGQIEKVVNFYHPRCIDPTGGFFQFFRSDGSVYQPEMRHLVSSTRCIFNYAMAYQQFKMPSHLEAISHGVNYLRAAHRSSNTGGYAWVLREGNVVDGTNHCYGLAFVTLAYAKAVDAGILEARPFLYETWELLEKYFWEPQYGLYADEATSDWRVSEYRGQNPNMHLCEAFLAAYEATQDQRFLARAELLADNMVNRQAALCGGQVWEHYDSSWRIDWNYNKGDRTNIFRPWGLQPGHQVEWAKLLLILDRHAPAPWRLQRARELFDISVRLAWDETKGGLIYGYDDKGAPYDCDKYSWVQVEALATAALLGQLTHDKAYWDWYEKLWAYSSHHFIDSRFGCWYRILNPDNSRYEEEGCFSGLTDYHTIGACCEVLNILT